MPLDPKTGEMMVWMPNWKDGVHIDSNATRYEKNDKGVVRRACDRPVDVKRALRKQRWEEKAKA